MTQNYIFVSPAVQARLKTRLSSPGLKLASWVTTSRFGGWFRFRVDSILFPARTIEGSQIARLPPQNSRSQIQHTKPGTWNVISETPTGWIENRESKTRESRACAPAVHERSRSFTLFRRGGGGDPLGERPRPRGQDASPSAHSNRSRSAERDVETRRAGKSAGQPSGSERMSFAGKNTLLHALALSYTRKNKKCLAGLPSDSISAGGKVRRERRGIHCPAARMLLG